MAMAGVNPSRSGNGLVSVRSSEPVARSKTNADSSPPTTARPEYRERCAESCASGSDGER
jgi:hypothetical protein